MKVGRWKSMDEGGSGPLVVGFYGRPMSSSCLLGADDEDEPDKAHHLTITCHFAILCTLNIVTVIETASGLKNDGIRAFIQFAHESPNPKITVKRSGVSNWYGMVREPFKATIFRYLKIIASYLWNSPKIESKPSKPRIQFSDSNLESDCGRQSVDNGNVSSGWLGRKTILTLHPVDVLALTEGRQLSTTYLILYFSFGLRRKHWTFLEFMIS